MCHGETRWQRGVRAVIPVPAVDRGDLETGIAQPLAHHLGVVARLHDSRRA